MSFTIDLQFGAVSAPLIPAVVAANGNGSSNDLSAGILSTNLVLNIGAGGGSGSVKAQESDDGSTWTDITGSTFTVVAGDANSVKVLRVLRRKRYVRGVQASVSGTLVVALTAIAQKQYVFDPNDPAGNSGVAAPVTAA